MKYNKLYENWQRFTSEKVNSLNEGWFSDLGKKITGKDSEEQPSDQKEEPEKELTCPAIDHLDRPFGKGGYVDYKNHTLEECKHLLMCLKLQKEWLNDMNHGGQLTRGYIVQSLFDSSDKWDKITDMMEDIHEAYPELKNIEFYDSWGSGPDNPPLTVRKMNHPDNKEYFKNLGDKLTKIFNGRFSLEWWKKPPYIR